MAGTPKKRAKRAIQQALTEAAATFDEASPVAEATVLPPAHPTRARARETETLRTPPPVRPAAGAQTRMAVDKSQVDVMNALAKHIRPGLTVRIERLRPHWCAGWIEDYPLESPDTLGTFYNYVREEHGGQFYRLTVLAAGEQQLYQAQVPISGRPRELGKLIDRGMYEGHGDARSSNPARTQVVPTQDNGTFGPMMQFVGLFIEQMRESNKAQLDSVREMVGTSQKQTSELAQAVLQVREGARPPSLGQQLSEVVEATRAVDNVRKVLGGTARRTGAAVDEDGDDMKLLAREVSKTFIKNAVGGMFNKHDAGTPQGRTQAPQGPQPVGQVRPIRQQNRRVVLDAVTVSGQTHAKN